MDQFGGQGGQGDEKAEQVAAMAQFTKLLESQKTIAKLTGKCFQACVPSAGKSLANAQQLCLWRCAQRYMETQYFVQRYCEDKIQAGAWSAPA
mmetsp:Transcript_93152/g.236935  ORF Transcript_93152/g.236935 Transcript_93152/m.236935 type:complete len:93 (+) Transcript_93152:103-381(+)